MRDERPLSAVPRGVSITLVIALAFNIGLQLAQPRPVATAEALHAPPTVNALRVTSIGEPVALAQLTTLYLQAYDNQPGVSIPFQALDYNLVMRWLKTVLDLDPRAQYPLMLASQVYLQVPDISRQRAMTEFVHEQFLLDPNARWRWLAHVTIMAKHRLKDNALALAYAADITHLATRAPNWARQMQIFILEDIGELESARIMLGGLLAEGKIKDEHEIHFLTERLETLKNAENSTDLTKK